MPAAGCCLIFARRLSQVVRCTLSDIRTLSAARRVLFVVCVFASHCDGRVSSQVRHRIVELLREAHDPDVAHLCAIVGNRRVS
jgi:hypothetical protein